MALIAWYKLAGNLLDSAQLGSLDTSGVINGTGVSYTTGKLGASCLTFGTGNTGYVELPTWLSFNTQSSFSFAAWILIPSSYVWRTEGATGIIINRRSYAGSFGLGKNSSNNTLGFFLRTIDSQSNSLSVTISRDTWHHIVGSYDGLSGAMRLYKDGSLASQGTAVHSPVSYFYESQVRVGGGTVLAGNGAGYFEGSVDDIRIYDHALSAKEAKELSLGKVLHLDLMEESEYSENLFVGETITLGAGTITPADSWYALTSDASGNSSRFYAPLAKLVNAATYTGSLEVLNPNDATITATIDWCDVASAAFTLSPFETRRIFVTGAKATYDATFRFLDIAFTASSKLYVKSVQIEAKDHATKQLSNGVALSKPLIDRCGNSFVPTSNGPAWNSLVKAYQFGDDKYLLSSAAIPLTTRTVCAWIYKNAAFPESGIGGVVTDLHHSNFQNMSLWVNSSSIQVQVGYTDNTRVDTAFNTTIADNTWYHIAYTYNATTNTLTCYKNGAIVGSATVLAKTPKFSSLQWGIGQWSVNSYINHYEFPGFIKDVRAYATALPASDILDIYQSKAAITHRHQIFARSAEETSSGPYVPSLIDYSTWVVGKSGTPLGWSLNGGAAENQFIVYPNPVGKPDITWAALNNDVTSDSDGGFVTAAFSIDRTKRYRYSIWIRRENILTGTTYFGCYANSVYNLGTTTKNNNPYFISIAASSSLNYFNNSWALLVAYIHPSGYTGGIDATTGIYNGTTHVKMTGINDFLWAADATIGTSRSYLYYSTSPDERQYFYRPRVDICDGTEPTIEDLLHCRENPCLIDYAYTGRDLYKLGSSFGSVIRSTNTNLTAEGNFYRSTAGGSVWDEGFSARQGFKGGAYLRFKVSGPNGTDHYMVGINSDPTTDFGYNTIDYAWYATHDTNAAIWESGVEIAAVGHIDFNPGDELVIWYDTSNISACSIKYYRNGTLVRTVSGLAHNLTFYLDGSFHSNTSLIQNQVYDLVWAASPPTSGVASSGYEGKEISEIGPVKGLISLYDMRGLSMLPDKTSSAVYIKNGPMDWQSGVDSWNGYRCTVAITDTILRATLTAANGNLERTFSALNGQYIRMRVRSSVTRNISFCYYDGATYPGFATFSLTANVWAWVEAKLSTGSTNARIYITHAGAIGDYLDVSHVYVGAWGEYSSQIRDIFGGNHTTPYGVLPVSLESFSPGFRANIPALKFSSFNVSGLTAPYHPSLAPASAVSVSVWAYATGWNSLSAGALVSKTETGGWGLRVNETAGQTNFSVYSNGAYNGAYTATNFTDGWHHFVGTYDGRYEKIYVGGVLKTTYDKGAIYPITYTYNNAMWIGAEPSSLGTQTPVNAAQPFNGLIGEVRIYNRAIALAEVQDLYALGSTSVKFGETNTFVDELVEY